MITQFNLRLVLPLLIGSFAIIITLFAYIANISTVSGRIQQQKIYETTSTLNMAQAVFEQLLLHDEQPGVRQVTSSMASQADIVDFIVSDADDQLISSFNSRHIGLHWSALELGLQPQLIKDVISQRNNHVALSSDGDHIEAYASLCRPDTGEALRQHDCGFLFIRRDVQRSIQHATALLQKQVMLTGIGISLAAFILWLVIYTLVTKRTLQLVEVVDDYVRGKRKIKADITGNDELATLGRVLDNALEKLEKDESSLRMREAFHRAILNSARYSIIATDTRGFITSFNKSAEQLLGYTAAEVVNRETPAIFHDPDEIRQRALELSEELGKPVEPGFEVFVAKARGDHSDDREWTYITRSGNRIPVNLSVTAIRDNNQEITGFLGVATDIRLRKQAEQLARESEEKVRAILNAANDAIITTDHTGTIVSCNPAVHELFGYHPDQLVRGNIELLIPDDDFTTTPDDGHSEEYASVREIRGRTRSGESVPLELSISEFSTGGERMYTGIFRDISQRKAYEQGIINAINQAEEASRAKSAFLATMSHEIRTPMNGMLGMAQLLAGTRLDDTQQEYIDILIQSGNVLLKQINDILDLSRIEADKLEIENTIFNFTELCKDITALMQNRADEKDIELKVTLTNSVPDLVIGDSHRIRQILLNLVGNAIKFTHRGHVHLYVDSQPLDQHLRLFNIRVEDTGIGIPAENIDHLFDSFTQADQSTTREYGGSGLGLAICKRLARLMGAELLVESTQNQGTVFSLNITLATANEQSLAELPEIAPASDAMKGKVLLVEDNRVNMIVAEAMLKNLGLEVVSAENGRQAVDMFGTQHFDLVLMDCQMPVMDGYEATRKIRASNTEIPIIAVTANVFPEDVKKCLDVGMNACLHKPVDSRELQSTLADWLAVEPPELELDEQQLNSDSSGPTSAHVDPIQLNRLKPTLGDLFDQLIPGYIEDTDEAFSTLDELIARQDYKALERFVHSLKSSSRNMGANPLADTAEKMETAIRKQQLDDFLQLRPELEQLYASTRNELLLFNRQ